MVLEGKEVLFGVERPWKPCGLLRDVGAKFSAPAGTCVNSL
jgi:hypothetical protein